MIVYIKQNFIDLPKIGAVVISKLIKLAIEGKNVENMGMTAIKDIYTNEDVPWSQPTK